jgi:RHS repeat-associated protein
VTKRFFANGEQISGTSYYYTKDQLGSIREMTDGSGTIQAQYAYDPYGIVTELQGSMNADFQYAGYYMHQPSTLNFTIYRPYSAALGRWLLRDPLGEMAGANLYGYVGNNPISQTDSTGLAPVAGGGGCVENQVFNNLMNGDINAPVPTCSSPSKSCPRDPGSGGGAGGDGSASGGGAVGGGGGSTPLDNTDFGKVGDAGAGLGDALTYGVTDALRRGTGGSDQVDKSSGAYNTGVDAGTVLGYLLGKEYPTKIGAGGRPQPYDPATGKYLSKAANPGAVSGPLGSFLAGVGQGLASGYTGSPTPPAVNNWQGRGQALGSLLSNLIP